MMTVKTAENVIGQNTLHISPERLGYSGIYLDFVAGKPPAADFYLAESLESVAQNVDQIGFDRTTIVSILRRQNEAYGASSAAMANLEKLKDPRALCVFAGQQAGLYSGPMLTIIKAMGIIKAAELYSEELKRPVIPIFWIAGDDHDFDEANHTFVLKRTGELCKNSYQVKPDNEVPTAEIELGNTEELKRLDEQLHNCLGDTDFTENLHEMIGRAYTPDDTLVTAFGKLMASMLSEFGLLLFSPGDTEAKRLAVPFFKAVVEKQDQIHELLDSANRRIEEVGYHIQVEKSEKATHLFYNHDGRRPVMREDDRFVAGDESFTQDELLARIEETPERFSPDVMTRPVFQSYLFPVLSQKGGPAEIAYLAQLNPLFELFGVATPVHKARPTLTILENRTARLMDEMDIEFEDLLGDIEQVINRVLSKTFPADLEADFQALRDSVASGFRKFIDEALAFDSGLQKFAGQTEGKVDFILKGFESKLFAAHKKKSQQTRDRIYRINNAMYPHRGLQERCLNITYFLSRYGTGVIKYIFDRMDSEETAHQIISMSEFEN
jgi:bacillithiol biosynthesis cysteine-adding enzyme BshC